MNINLPDRLYKLLVLIGIAFISYSFYEIDLRSKNYDQEFRTNLDLLDAATQAASGFTMQINDAKSELDKFRNSPAATDSIFAAEKQYANLVSQRDFTREKLKHLIDSRDHAYQMYQTKKNLFKFLLVAGTFIFIIGLVAWVNDENKTTKIIIRQEEKLYEFCQSCGKKFSAVRVNGSHADGSTNNAFCKECYDEGQFTNPALTQSEVLNVARDGMQNMNWYNKRLIVSRIRNLERWKSGGGEY